MDLFIISLYSFARPISSYSFEHVGEDIQKNHCIFLLSLLQIQTLIVDQSDQFACVGPTDDSGCTQNYEGNWKGFANSKNGNGYVWLFENYNTYKWCKERMNYLLYESENKKWYEKPFGCALMHNKNEYAKKYRIIEGSKKNNPDLIEFMEKYKKK